MERNSDFSKSYASETGTVTSNDSTCTPLQSLAFTIETEPHPSNRQCANTTPQDKHRMMTSKDGENYFDEYLTNIKWLGRLSCKGLIPELETTRIKAKSVKICSSRSKERPAKSYSEIIQQAINSTQAKKMTLQQIYTWVEDHFPYYRDSAKPGWKNSIRHTLSVRDAFVREAGVNEKISFWKVKPHSHSDHHLENRTVHLQVGQPSRQPTVKFQRHGKKILNDSQIQEKKEKRMKPILPRGPAPVMIPVFISHTVTSANVQQSSQSKKAKPTPIAPKIQFLLRSDNVSHGDDMYPVRETSVEKSTIWNTTEQQRIVAKRWKGYRGNRCPPSRTTKHKLHPQMHIEDSALEADLNQMSPVHSGKQIQSIGEDVAGSPVKTPTKMTVLQGVSTSTPCKNETSVLSPTSMLLSLLPALTPPKVEDNHVFDCSFLKSPNDESLGYVSLGFPDNPPMAFQSEDSDHDLAEFLGCTPIQSDSFTDTPGVDQHNESFSKLFSDFSIPNLGDGIDMANLSWSYIYNRN
ncbi:forkhead box protein M1-like [Ambystoma mexicanum]|uniref:forkhead box protein M1-like n=1 Tax=Ambystoma mexicanum TaxID=8296 RepID=UPI0037E89B83